MKQKNLSDGFETKNVVFEVVGDDIYVDVATFSRELIIMAENGQLDTKLIDGRLCASAYQFMQRLMQMVYAIRDLDTREKALVQVGACKMLLDKLAEDRFKEALSGR